MRAEFISRFGTAGPIVKLYFDTQAEYIAWEWLLSKAEGNRNLMVLDDGIDGPHMSCSIGAGPYQPPSNGLEIKGHIVVGKSESAT